MFKHKIKVSLHHTDAAGRLFFAQQLYFVHETKEHFMASLGLPIAKILTDPETTFPIVHAEADYKIPLMAGDEIDVEMTIEKIGETSVIFNTVLRKNGQVAGTAKTVNVSVCKRTNQKMPIPQEWRTALASGM